MNKHAIQKFAIWARNELIDQVKQRAFQYGISDQGYEEEDAGVVAGRVLASEEWQQRHAFVRRIMDHGYQQAVEDVAYTWFNRLIALRFMEVNDYLPSHVRVFSDANGDFKPEILTEVLHLDLPDLDRMKVSVLLNANQTEALYRYLLLTQCNALNEALPEMFEKLGGYTELLLPNNILRPEGVIGRLVKDIPEDDFRDAVQIIGWLYQYYNTEPKQAVFDDLKKNVKISKETIPAATQLFTPDWIVRYMVENSVGRLWLESHPNDALKANWTYYLDEAEQTPEVAERLRVLRSQSPVKSPEDVRLIDPCMGSGHILVYAFDVLMQIYESVGVSPRDAAKLILEKNLYGLDIDRRAYQLAYFALMMKARQYNRHIFTEDVKPQVYYPAGFPDGEEYGSLLKVDVLPPKPDEPKEITLFTETYETALNAWNFQSLLAQKYDVVVTNPPYMGASGMGTKLSEFVKENYSDCKSDLFAAFIEKCDELLKTTGYQAMITQHAWMFLSSYETLRGKLLHRDVVNMVHLGAGAFEEIGGEVVQTTAFVLSKGDIADLTATYVRLVDYGGQQAKEDAFLSGKERYTTKKENFAKIPGSPVAYWVSENAAEIFDNHPIFDDVATTRAGMITGNNDIFVRLWHEVSWDNMLVDCETRDEAIESRLKWFPYSKGGAFRRWYGNNEYVVDWYNDGLNMRNFKNSSGKIPAHAFNLQYIFRENLCWNSLSSYIFSARHSGRGFLYDASGSFASCGSNEKRLYYLAYLNSCVAFYYLSAINPTLNFQKGNVGALPVIVGKDSEQSIDDMVKRNVALSRADWDSFETSWDFSCHPLICGQQTVATAFSKWEHEATERFYTLKANEEELNRIFINIYGLKDELKPEVKDKNVSLKTNTAYRYKQQKGKSNEDEFEMEEEIIVEAEEIRRAKFLHDTICEFISYAVGCMFGRYSLDAEGLAYAGGTWDASKYRTFIPVQDNILPICDDEYFDDDIVGRFVEFIQTVYGADTMEDNLKFVADALGARGTPRAVIRKYFLNDFYADHCKIYQKRPIYWMFDSGKKNGFKALVYLHRYAPNLLATLRTDYVHEQQERYRTQLTHIVGALNTVSGAERARLLKQQNRLTEQLQEIGVFEEKVHHLADRHIELDLDNGVKKNYAVFADVMAKL